MRIITAFLPVLLLITITACNNTKETDEGKKDTMVVINKNEPAASTPAPSTPPATVQPEVAPAPAPDWRALMGEYHDVLCRAHKNVSQPNDKIRQAELLIELNKAKKNLSDSEKVFFTTEMARTVNMKSCK